MEPMGAARGQIAPQAEAPQTHLSACGERSQSQGAMQRRLPV
jgi:hypothetical protein